MLKMFYFGITYLLLSKSFKGAFFNNSVLKLEKNILNIIYLVCVLKPDTVLIIQTNIIKAKVICLSICLSVTFSCLNH